MPHIPPSELMIRQRLSALGRGLAGARAGDVNGVHQARVATRRLREALPLVAPGTKGRKLERSVRKLTRALGPVRELDVAMEMLDELARQPDAPHQGIVRLRELIVQERAGHHTDVVRSIERCDLARLRRKAVAAIRRGEDDGGARAARSEERRASAQRAGRRAERLVAAIENAAGLYLPDRLHEVRIAVKKLRYALEISQQVSGARNPAPGRGRSLRSMAGRMAVLKDAQDLLGHMHDLEILIMRSRAVQGTASASDLRVSEDLDRLVRSLETECRQLHGQYMTVRPRLLSIAERTVAAAERAARRATAA
jgi:CHAD domain-containing protein